MIGLGTNRLSASRLAGLREARQFRNGQWLEGAGSWYDPSPYSAAATAALKAAFSAAQWAIIRDYGFAHPALVPFINEDPMLVMSLIEGLGTRWQYADDNSYIATNIVPDNTAYLSVRLRVRTNWSDSMFGASYSSSVRECGFGANNNRYLAFHGNYQWFSKRAEVGQIVRYTDNAGNVTLDFGDVVETKTFTNTYECPVNFYVFALHRQSNIYPNGPIYEIDHLELRKGNEEVYLVPYSNGMLDIHDLEHPVFYPNAGTGTFTTSETPAS